MFKEMAWPCWRPKKSPKITRGKTYYVKSSNDPWYEVGCYRTIRNIGTDSAAMGVGGVQWRRESKCPFHLGIGTVIP